MEFFKKNTVHMRDPNAVQEMVSLLIKDGAAKLQVISDFDNTISRSHLNGKRCTSTYEILQNCSFVSDDSRRQCNLLEEHYYPIEIDPHLSLEEKIPHLKERYDKSDRLIVACGIKKENIKEIVQASKTILRDGCDAFFGALHNHSVPLLIFSAGVGDILEEALQQQGQLYPNMKIIANFMQFDEEEKFLGFKDDPIFTFTKTQSSIKNGEYFEHWKTRSNIILLGDSLGDIDMSGGVKDANCILKIGFLNEKIDENLPRYLKAYDIVLVEDQTMDLVNGLLQSII